MSLLSPLNSNDRSIPLIFTIWAFYSTYVFPHPMFKRSTCIHYTVSAGFLWCRMGFIVKGFYCLSSRLNWVPPLPPPRASVAPPPHVGLGRGSQTRLRGRGWGDPIQTNGQKLSFSLRDSWSDSSSRNLGSSFCGPDLARYIKMKTDQTN